MEAAGIAAGRIPVAGPCFRRKGTTGAGTLLVNTTVCIDAKNSL